MTDPFSILGVGLGVASLFLQVTDECIKRYKYFTEASQMAHCYQYLRVRMQIEQQRFLSFAAQAAPLSKDGQVCSALQINQSLLISVLLEVKNVFEKLEASEAKYGDIVQQRGINWNDKTEPQTDLIDMLRLPCLESAVDSSRDFSALRGIRKIGHRISEIARKLRTVLHDPRRLVWVSVDKEAFESLITKLSDLNSFLIAILNTSETRRMVRIVESNNWEIRQLQRNLTNLNMLVQNIGRENKSRITYQDFANIKGRRVLNPTKRCGDQVGTCCLGDLENQKFDRIEPGHSRQEVIQGSGKSSTTLMLDIAEFNYTTTGPDKDCNGGRIIASWENQSVWIEWMDFSPSIGKTNMETIRETRVSLLTETLHDDITSAFGSPRCLGYVKSSKENAESKFGMVFETPPYENPQQRLLSLRQLLETCPKPSLSARLSLSSALADCISNFHSEGWLHKGLKSENILFFGGRITDSHLSMPYISGFDSSRPAENTEMTEEAVFDPRSDIYRHPHAQFGEAKNSYRKSYDIYSFGVILMETALWKPIEDILGIENILEVEHHTLRSTYDQLLGQPAQTGGDAETRNSSYLADAAKECGDAYREIVGLCLEANNVERPSYRGEPKSAIDAKIRVMFDQVRDKLRFMKNALNCT